MDIVLQEFENNLERCRHYINLPIADRFNDYEDFCEDKNTTSGILDCAKTKIEFVKGDIQNDLQGVVEFAAILNYELESMHH